MLRKTAVGLIAICLAGVLTTGDTGSAQGQQFEGIIRGFVFFDRDADGIRETGESGVAQTVVCRDRRDFCDFTESGEYMFDLLGPGRYTIFLRDWPDEFRPTTPPTVRVVLGEDEIRILHFGITPKRP